MKERTERAKQRALRKSGETAKPAGPSKYELKQRQQFGKANDHKQALP